MIQRRPLSPTQAPVDRYEEQATHQDISPLLFRQDHNNDNAEHPHLWQLFPVLHPRKFSYPYRSTITKDALYAPNAAYP